MTIDDLRAMRERMMPMLQAVAKEYETRTEPGYPVVLDNVESGGYFGISLDPGYALYIMSDGERLTAQLSIIGWRNDVRSAANKEKFASLPFEGVREVSPALSNEQLRNMIGELLSHWNFQPLMIYHTDS